MTYEELREWWRHFTGCDYPGDDTPEDNAYGEKELKEIIENDIPWQSWG